MTKADSLRKRAEVARAIARDAYIYGFPIVMGYKAMYSYAVDENDPDYRGPFNQLQCEARLMTPEDQAIVSPNADTPYCTCWMDLRAEPVVLSVPAMEPERFYHVQLVDLYTHNFAYVGSLTTGHEANRFVIAGPRWRGKRPEGIRQVLRSETDFVFAIVRTQLFGPGDLPKVRDIQGSYRVEPLSAYRGAQAPAAAPTPAFPPWVEGAQFDERLFGYLDFMLALLRDPPDEERALWERMARIGLGPRGEFDVEALAAEVRNALRAGAADGLEAIEQHVAAFGDDPLASAKLFGTREFLNRSAERNYGHQNPYLIRAVAAHIGLYGNSASEALYPAYLADADGQPFDASTSRYTMTFPEGELPPVNAFWSLTLYDARTQLFADNPLDRYRLSSTMMDQFRFEPDGSLVLYIGRDSPGPALEPNWLPAPDGPFYLVLRLYGPRAEALDGRWSPPELRES